MKCNIAINFYLPLKDPQNRSFDSSEVNSQKDTKAGRMARRVSWDTEIDRTGLPLEIILIKSYVYTDI
jgi:hypothetical protein